MALAQKDVIARPDAVAVRIGGCMPGIVPMPMIVIMGMAVVMMMVVNVRNGGSLA